MGPYFDFGAVLDAIDSVSPAAAVDVVIAELAERVGASEVSFLIVDYSGHVLVWLAGVGSGEIPQRPASEWTARVPLPGTPQERTLQRQEIQTAPEDAGTRLFAPVTHRGEALGVLELLLPSHPDERMRDYIVSAAHALAYTVIVNGRHTDRYEWGQRTFPLSLSAEIQRRLLPDLFTCEAEQFTLAGWLEPASDVGGDTFDYTLDSDLLHVSMTDAMGHDVDAAQLASLLVGTLRNARRQQVSLADQAHMANEALATYARADQFVTGQLVRIDLTSHAVAIVNAGHPPPFRLRNGRVEELDLVADVPFGAHPTTAYQVQQLSLQPGDRLVFVTDGMLERNAARLDIHATLADTRELHPRETVHALTEGVLGAMQGQLSDDATVLCLDWHGSHGLGRQTSAGASQRRATP